MKKLEAEAHALEMDNKEKLLLVQHNLWSKGVLEDEIKLYFLFSVMMIRLDYLSCNN